MSLEFHFPSSRKLFLIMLRWMCPFSAQFKARKIKERFVANRTRVTTYRVEKILLRDSLPNIQLFPSKMKHRER